MRCNVAVSIDLDFTSPGGDFADYSKQTTERLFILSLGYAIQFSPSSKLCLCLILSSHLITSTTALGIALQENGHNHL